MTSLNPDSELTKNVMLDDVLVLGYQASLPIKRCVSGRNNVFLLLCCRLNSRSRASNARLVLQRREKISKRK